MSIKQFIDELLTDPDFREEYFKKDIAFEISEMIIDLRIKFGLTQLELARKVGTHQSSIARLERGSYLPSLSFLLKIARALNIDLISPQFSILVKENNTYNVYNRVLARPTSLKSSFSLYQPYGQPD